VPGASIQEKIDALRARLWNDQTGESTGIMWPPPALHPSRVFFGSPSSPVYSGKSQAVPFIMLWQVVASIGTVVNKLAVIGDDQFWDLMIWFVMKQHEETITTFALGIQDYPALIYRSPKFRLDRARDLVAITVWKGSTLKEQSDCLLQLVNEAMDLRYKDKNIGAIQYPWSIEQEQELPAFIVMAIQPEPAIATTMAATASERDEKEDGNLGPYRHGRTSIRYYQKQQQRGRQKVSGQMQDPIAADDVAIP
jgi:hypothetical protein